MIRFAVVMLGLALALAACSGSAEEGATDSRTNEAENATTDLADDGAAPETSEEVDYCSFLTFDEVEEALGLAPVSSEPLAIRDGCSWFEEGNESSLALLVLEVADDAYSLDGVPASRFDRTIERGEISSITTTSVDGLGDKAVVQGGPPPNAVAVVVGDTYVQIIVNDGELVGPRTVESLAALLVDRL